MLRQLADDGGDLIDVAAETTQDEISSQLAEVESRELGLIEEALVRLREGRYGDCESCEKTDSTRTSPSVALRFAMHRLCKKTRENAPAILPFLR